MTSNLPLTLLAVSRIGVGTASFLLPGLTTTSLFYPLPAGSLFAVLIPPFFLPLAKN
jgi:hypothetical protein